MKYFIVASICLLCANPAWSQKKQTSGNLRVVILRHGEKPEQGDNLSCAGMSRALQLPAVLVKLFGVPDYTYVPAASSGKNTKSVRMMQTIWPLAVKYNLSLNSKYEVDQTTDLSQDILKRSGTVVVVWEHKNIPDIAAAIGVKGKLKWPDNDFDTIWIVTVDHGKVKFHSTREGITATNNCSF